MALIDANGREIESGDTLKNLYGRTRRRVIAIAKNLVDDGAWVCALGSTSAQWLDAETLALFWAVEDA